MVGYHEKETYLKYKMMESQFHESNRIYLFLLQDIQKDMIHMQLFLHESCANSHFNLDQE